MASRRGDRERQCVCVCERWSWKFNIVTCHLLPSLPTNLTCSHRLRNIFLQPQLFCEYHRRLTCFISLSGPLQLRKTTTGLHPTSVFIWNASRAHHQQSIYVSCCRETVSKLGRKWSTSHVLNGELPLSLSNFNVIVIFRTASTSNLEYSTQDLLRRVDLKTDMGNNTSSHQRMPSSIRHKQRELIATLPKQPKPEHSEIERRFNQVLVSPFIYFQYIYLTIAWEWWYKNATDGCDFRASNPVHPPVECWWEVVVFLWESNQLSVMYIWKFSQLKWKQDADQLASDNIWSQSNGIERVMAHSRKKMAPRSCKKMAQ